MAARSSSRGELRFRVKYEILRARSRGIFYMRVRIYAGTILSSCLTYFNCQVEI